MKQKLMKIRLEKTQRTDLICIGCGNFRTEWAIVPALGAEPQAGVHTKCAQELHQKKQRKVSSQSNESGRFKDVAARKEFEKLVTERAGVSERQARRISSDVERMLVEAFASEVKS